MSRRQISLVQINRSRFCRFRDQGNNRPPWAAFSIRQTCVNARTSKRRLLRSSIWLCRCRGSCDRGKYDNMKQGLQSLQSLNIVDMAYMCGCTNRIISDPNPDPRLEQGILSAWEVILFLLESAHFFPANSRLDRHVHVGSFNSSVRSRSFSCIGSCHWHG